MGGEGRGLRATLPWLAVLSLVALFVFESAAGARGDSLTSDEGPTIASGYGFLVTRRVLLNPEHPMVAKSLLALPLLFLGPRLDPGATALHQEDQYLAAHRFLWENRVPGPRLLLAARSAQVGMGVLLLAVIYLGARALYGQAGGLLALLLAATCPDLLAHAHLATLDVPLSLGAALSLAALLGYARCPGRRRLWLLGLALGFTLGTKIAALQVLPCLAVAALAGAWLDPDIARRARLRVPGWLAGSGRLASGYVLLGGLLVASGYGVLLLAASYLGSPRAYLAGLSRNALLSGYGHPTYLLEEVSRSGFPHYFLVALGVKLPVLTLGILLVALLGLPWQPSRRAALEGPILAFTLAWLVLVSLGPAQTGVRYALPAYPGLFVLGARVSRMGLRGPLRAVLAAAVVLGQLSVVARDRPLYLSSFNELVGGPEAGLRVLADSNIDWGQDLGRLAAWLRERPDAALRLAPFCASPPEVYGIRYQALPAAGPVLYPPGHLAGRASRELVAISANNLVGLVFQRDLYAGFRARPPDWVVGGSIWVYDLGTIPRHHELLAAIYHQAGWERWALHELELGRVCAGPPEG